MKEVLKCTKCELTTNKFRNPLQVMQNVKRRAEDNPASNHFYSADLRYGANVATFVGFKKLPASPVAPVPVLVVYAAEDPAFQGAVVALVEFLQSYGGCSVAVDMWQQRKIAELGPMRWLAEKVKTAQRVLIVCPKVDRAFCVILNIIF